MSYRIALMNDNPLVVSALQGTLLGAGYEVRRLSFGIGAHEILPDLSPHAVVIDLPLTEGAWPWRVVEDILRAPALGNIPILVYAAGPAPAAFAPPRPCLAMPKLAASADLLPPLRAALSQVVDGDSPVGVSQFRPRPDSRRAALRAEYLRLHAQHRTLLDDGRLLHGARAGGEAWFAWAAAQKDLLQEMREAVDAYRQTTLTAEVARAEERAGSAR